MSVVIGVFIFRHPLPKPALVEESIALTNYWTLAGLETRGNKVYRILNAVHLIAVIALFECIS